MIKMSKSQDVRDEAVAKIKVQIPGSERQPANLEVKVDTGAKGNILPLRIFSQMCPDKMASDDKPVAGMTRESKSVLSASANLKNYNTYSLQTSRTVRPLSPLVPIDTFKLIQITILHLKLNPSF